MSNPGDFSTITISTVNTFADAGTTFDEAEPIFDDAEATFDDAEAIFAVAGFSMGTDPLVGDESDWHERALCAQTDPEAFFPEKGGSTREAKKICTGCEVRSECLSYALANDERFGIWGGLSERERRRLKRSAS